jgi:hypothetical protein
MRETDDNCPPESPATEVFADALAAGDGETAAKALREMKKLEGSMLELLADLFDPKSKLSQLDSQMFPKVIRFKNRTAGKPTHALKTRAREFKVGMMVIRRAKEPGQVEAAVADVMKRCKLSRAAVYRAYRSIAKKNSKP